jgi:hypothetical protein
MPLLRTRGPGRIGLLQRLRREARPHLRELRRDAATRLALLQQMGATGHLERLDREWGLS